MKVPPHLVLDQPWIPGLDGYWVLHLRDVERSLSDDERTQMLAAAHRIARELALERHGDPDCFSLLFNGARTRRTKGDHVHILLSTSVPAKRRRFFWLHLKQIVRPIARALGLRSPSSGAPLEARASMLRARGARRAACGGRPSSEHRLATPE